MNDNSLNGLGSLLSQFLRGMDLDTRIKEHTCLLVWNEVVGDQVADAAQPEFVKDGVMFVTTKSSVWANELVLYKRDIIAKLNSRVGNSALRDIVFKSGRVIRSRQKKILNTDGPDLAGIKLTNEELERIEAIAGAAGEEASPSLQSMLIAAAKLEKWKKIRGWTPCKKCGALHGNPSPVCPVCDIKP